ncbi:hypothetical protein ACJ41O_000092 [Fusarium nematophilum]
MANSRITLQTSSASIQGIVDERFGRSTWHFRGIRYGRIQRRFAKPQYPNVDVGHLLRLPRNISTPRIDEDEFKCLNLNISTPADEDVAGKGLLPVLVWIHECDRPIIIVTINYRLNIFAFGDGEGERNLALQDQQLALEWVSKNIQDFGGDPPLVSCTNDSVSLAWFRLPDGCAGQTTLVPTYWRQYES